MRVCAYSPWVRQFVFLPVRLDVLHAHALHAHATAGGNEGPGRSGPTRPREAPGGVKSISHRVKSLLCSLHEVQAD